MRVIFCKIGWMKYYKGVTEKDPIFNGGSFVKENGNGGEAYNFQSVPNEDGNEYCYGFFETKFKNGYKSSDRISNQLHIERIDSAAKNSDELDDVLVIWCATKERNEHKVVGWYKNATVYRNYQELEFDNGYIQDYNIIAAKNDCVLLPYDKQNSNIWDIPSSKKQGYGFGQSLVWYAEEEKAVEYVGKLVNNINTYDGANYIDVDETNDPIEMKKIKI